MNFSRLATGACARQAGLHGACLGDVAESRERGRDLHPVANADQRGWFEAAVAVWQLRDQPLRRTAGGFATHAGRCAQYLTKLQICDQLNQAAVCGSESSWALARTSGDAFEVAEAGAWRSFRECFFWLESLNITQEHLCCEQIAFSKMASRFRSTVQSSGRSRQGNQTRVTGVVLGLVDHTVREGVFLS